MTQARYVAGRAGDVRAAEAGTVGGLALPPGRVISARGRDALWLADEHSKIGAMVGGLVATFSQHGLWPLVLDSLDGAPDRPWESDEIAPGTGTSPDDHKAQDVLARWWKQVIPADDEEILAPFGRDFPGLAPPSAVAPRLDAVEKTAGRLPARLGLVGVTRPADAVVALGWEGPVNHYDDMGLLAAVLRSWEDRFGAFVVAVGFDTLMLAVERPPADRDAATALAAEHFATCSDNIYQGAGTIEEYAKALVGRRVWNFWWD